MPHPRTSEETDQKTVPFSGCSAVNSPLAHPTRRSDGHEPHGPLPAEVSRSGLMSCWVVVLVRFQTGSPSNVNAWTCGRSSPDHDFEVRTYRWSPSTRGEVVMSPGPRSCSQTSSNGSAPPEGTCTVINTTHSATMALRFMTPSLQDGLNGGPEKGADFLPVGTACGLHHHAHQRAHGAHASLLNKR